ncbi:MAG: alpha/beta hydrolase [Acidimicrobiia bacterium]
MRIPPRARPIVAAVCGLLVALPACGGSGARASCSEGATKRTVQYASISGVPANLTSLDLHLPAGTGGCTKRPIVVWVHGGAWKDGDKSEDMAHKIPLFNNAGYVFASVNYRLTDDKTDPAHPSPQWPVHDQDAADAVAWIVHHAGEFRGDVRRVAVLGHSAGGGIVAAMTADPRYLGKSGLALSSIHCAGSMDGEGYDVVAGATTAPPEWKPVYLAAFGSDPTVWEEASPIRYVAADKGIARYFLAAQGIEWRLQQHAAWYHALQAAHVPVTVLDARSLEHADLTTAVGAPDDTVVTPALMDFLAGCFSR